MMASSSSRREGHHSATPYAPLLLTTSEPHERALDSFSSPSPSPSPFSPFPPFPDEHRLTISTPPTPQPMHGSATDAAPPRSLHLLPPRSPASSPSPHPRASSPASPRSLVDDYDVPTCRICFEGGGELIIPCLCSGSSLHIHRQCLDDWRAVSVGKRGFSHCSTCGFQYQEEASLASASEQAEMTWRYRLLVVRDVCVVLAAVQAALCAITFLIARADDAAGLALLAAAPSCPPYLLYYLASLVLSLACLGLFGLTAKACGWEDRLLRRHPMAEGACCEECCHRCGASDCCRYGGGWGRSLRGGGEGLLLLLVLVVVVLALFGVLYGVIYGGALLERLSSRHIKRRWYRSEVEKHRVIDFTHHLDSLRALARKAK